MFATTYRSCNLADLRSLLLVEVLDHVVAEEAHREVVVAPDDASEDRDACHCEEDVFDDLSSVHFLKIINFQII